MHAGAGKEFTKRKKCRGERFRFHFSKGGEGLGVEKCTSPTSPRTSPDGWWGCELLLGNGVAAELKVSAGLRLVLLCRVCVSGPCGPGSGQGGLVHPISGLPGFVCVTRVCVPSGHFQ